MNRHYFEGFLNTQNTLENHSKPSTTHKSTAKKNNKRPNLVLAFYSEFPYQLYYAQKSSSRCKKKIQFFFKIESIIRSGIYFNVLGRSRHPQRSAFKSRNDLIHVRKKTISNLNQGRHLKKWQNHKQFQLIRIFISISSMRLIRQQKLSFCNRQNEPALF